MKLQASTKTTNGQWMERWKKASMGNYAPASVAFERGQGSRLWDVEGKEYLDFAAGVAVCSTRSLRGHTHPTKHLRHHAHLTTVPRPS